MATIKKSLEHLENAIESLEESINIQKKNVVPLDHHQYITKQLKELKEENKQLYTITGEISTEVDHIICDLQKLLKGQ